MVNFKETREPESVMLFLVIYENWKQCKNQVNKISMLKNGDSFIFLVIAVILPSLPNEALE